MSLSEKKKLDSSDWSQAIRPKCSFYVLGTYIVIDMQYFLPTYKPYMNLYSVLCLYSISFISQLH